MGSISESMDQIIYVGIGVFVLVLLLSLTFQGYAQSNNQIIQGSFTCSGTSNVCSTNPSNVFFANVVNYGYAANYSKYAGPLPNTFGGSLQLAVFALVFIAVILAVVGALRGEGSSGFSGGFLGR